KRRKPSRQPRKRLPATSTDKAPPLDWMTEQSTPPRVRARNPALMSSGVIQPPPQPRQPALDPIGTPEGPLPLRAQTPAQLRAADVIAPAPTLERVPSFSVNEATPQPTLYPTEPGGTVIVHNQITINIHSTDFREFNKTVGELLQELRRSRSNEIAG